MVKCVSGIQSRAGHLLLLLSLFFSNGFSQEMKVVSNSMRQEILSELPYPSSSSFSQNDNGDIIPLGKGGNIPLRLGFYNYVGGPYFNKSCQWGVYVHDGNRGYFDYMDAAEIFTTIFEDPTGTPRYMIRPYWATWVGDRIVMAAFLEDVRVSQTSLTFFGYLSYEPHTRRGTL